MRVGVPAIEVADQREPYPVALTEARLVTLTGVGGVGKTRLAIRAAREMADAAGAGCVSCASTGVNGDNSAAVENNMER